MAEVPEADRCPYCQHEHYFNTINEEFEDGDDGVVCTVTTARANGKKQPVDIQLVLCSGCSAVIAVLVTDEFGEQLYLPPTKEWNEEHGY